MMTAEQPPEGASLAEWFDDPSASEEAQALRAWVAGLSNELAQARRERDEAQHALAAARAELERLRPLLGAKQPGQPDATPAVAHPAVGVPPVGMPVEPPAAPSDAAVSSTDPTRSRRLRLLAAALVVLAAAAVAVIVTGGILAR